MSARILAAAVLVICTVGATTAAPPRDWLLTGSNPRAYRVSVDGNVVYSGKSSALLASVSDSANGFGTLMQSSEASLFRSKRLKFSAYVRSRDVTDWAGLWLRVDAEELPVRRTLAFDNMQDRPIKGDSEWLPYSVVLDVPQAARTIAYGVLLAGPGRVWLAGAKFEVVDQDVPTTGRFISTQLLEPSNLNFEQ